MLFLHTPPMADVLGHIGRYSIQTGLRDHSWLKAYYGFEWRVIGNLGADLLVEALHPLLGVEAAAALIAALVPILAASGILLLSRQIHGRVTAASVLALSLIYAVPFTWGFLNFSLSMALALLAFNLWVFLERRGHLRPRALLFVPLGLAIWLCHTFGWALLGLLCGARSLTLSRKNGRNWPQALTDAALSCLPLLAPLLPMALWRNDAAASGIAGWFNPLAKVAWLIAMLRLDHEWFDKVSAVALLLVVYIGMRSPRVTADRTMATAALIAFIAYLLLPMQVFGSLYADMRLAPYVVMLALLSLRDYDRPRRMLMAFALAFLAMRLALTGFTYHQRERMLDAQMEALSAIPEGARLATLVQRSCESDWEMPWLTHVGSLALARKHLFANDQWAFSGMNLLSVHYPAAGTFATDTAEIVYPERCEGDGPTLAKSLAHLPLGAFTHVWVIGVPLEAIPHREGLTLIWKRADAAVFAVTAGHEPHGPGIRKLSKFQP
ncbi:hypothetical protein EDF56_101579 [Novosphingobium sp. PhB165]|nr:hypothetical protein EDF56_101579 [Novosphingobium sp. PhB165]